MYLEERIAIVRKALNEKSKQFGADLPELRQREFNQYIYDMLSVLDGFEDSFGEDAVKRLKK